MSAPSLPSAATVSVVDEVDQYSKSVQGVDIQGLRAGQGHGPNLIRATAGDGFIATSVDMGFPMLNRTTISDDVVIAAVIRSAPRGARWCEFDLETDMVVLYGAGVEHVATNPEGLGFSFAAIRIETLLAASESMGTVINLPARGEVSTVPGGAATAVLGRTISSVVDAATAGVSPGENHEDDVLHALANLLGGTPRREALRTGRCIDNRHVVRTCIEYATAIGRLPSVRELCMVAHVSERRLRLAFTQTFDMPPTRFFRLWALDCAYGRLRRVGGSATTVTTVAADLGFVHLGRFASYYVSTHGELPSATLARA